MREKGDDLFYRESGTGSGPLLFLSHSLGTDSAMWEPQLAGLGAGFRIVVYDHRGHGASGSPGGEWSLADFGRDLLGLADRLDCGRFHFCGLSLGGMVGLWLAEHFPDRLERLVVANTAAFTADPSLLRRRIEAVGRDGMGGIADDILDRWFTPAFARETPDTVSRFREMVLATSGETYRKTSEAILAMDLRPRLAEIDCPVLVISGESDEATPASWGREIAEMIPGAKWCSLPSAHLSNVECPGQFNEVVGGFLRG